MKDIISISLTRNNKRLLKIMIRTVFPTYRMIRIKSDRVVLRKHILSKKISIDLLEFMTMTLPNKLSKIAYLKGIDQPFNDFSNSADFLLHASDEENIDLIGFLWKKYNTVNNTISLSGEYSHKYRSIYSKKIIYNRILKKSISRIQDVVNSISDITFEVPKDQLVLMKTSNVAPIRGSPEVRLVA